MARARHAGAGVRRSTAGGVAALLLLGATAGGLYLTTRDEGPDRSLSAPATAPTSAPASASPSAAPSSPAAASSPAAPSSPAPMASVPSGAVPETLRECGRAVRAAEGAVEAASRGSRNWGVHVQAYRDVVDGDIRYGEADRQWMRTAKAGRSDVSRFDQALGAYDPAGDACRRAGQEAGGTSTALGEACAERAEVADAAVRRAGRVMERWEDHLGQMARRDSGRLGAAEARRLFRVAVSRTPGEIEALRRAQSRLERAPECDVPA